MTFKYRHRKQILIGMAIFFIILVISVSTIYYYNEDMSKTDKKDKKNESTLNIKPNNTKKPIKSTEEKNEIKENNNQPDKNVITYKVDIKGEIKKPGIYELKQGSRVIDVINAAGGLTNNANTSVINLSKKISDEMVIIVYSNNQVKEFQTTKDKEILEEDKCKNPNNSDIQNDACIDHNKENTPEKPNSEIKYPISINSATLKELENLPGIGNSKASEIIKYRNEHNGFKSLEELKKIPGIGEQIFAKIKENIIL